MNFNFAELQQKLDRVVFNADQFIRRYVDFALAPARDITIQYYDQYGNLQTFTVPNRQKLVNELYSDLPRSMVRTYYVDQARGDDGNDGTSHRPFKSLQKAVDMIPQGGTGYIHLLSNYTLDRSIHIANKTITIHLNGNTLTTVYEGFIEGHVLKHCIFLHGANLRIQSPGKIVIPPSPGGAPLAPMSYSFISSSSFVNSIIFEVGEPRNPSSEQIILEIYSGAFAGYNGRWEFGSQSFGHVGFQTLTVTTPVAIIANGAYLVDTAGRPFSIGISFTNTPNHGFLRRPDGTVINNFTEVVAGIIRDGNGVARNIISNRVL